MSLGATSNNSRRAQSRGKSAGRPVDGDSELTRRRILDAAVAEFSERGFNGTTLRQIAEVADLTAGTMYHHFATKREVYEAAFGYAVEGLYVGFDEIMKATSDLFTRIDSFLKYVIAEESLGRTQHILVLRAWVEQSHGDVTLVVPQVVRETMNAIIEDAVTNNELSKADGDLFIATYRSFVWGVAVLALNSYDEAHAAIAGIGRLLKGTLVSASARNRKG